MDGYVFESGLSRQDVDAALQALALSNGDEMAVLAARAGDAGQVGRVVFASAPMLGLFRADDLEAISARLFESRDPGAKKLADLVRNLASDAAPRLERLRFFFGPVAETVTFLCRKCAIGNEGPLLIAAALGLRARRHKPSPAPRPPTVAGALSFEEVKNILAARLAESKSARFLWRTDAAGKITEITPPLADIVGAATADVLGHDFGDVAKYLEQEPGGPLGRAIAKRETFSGIEVLWPIAGAAAAVPVSLGALPAFLPDHRFDGYRGFGVIRLDRLMEAKPREPMPGAIAPTSVPASAPVADNVVHLRPPVPAKSVFAETPERSSLHDEQDQQIGPLSDEEATAFREIAATLAEETARALPSEPNTNGRAPLQDENSIAAQLGRNAPMIFDRLGIGILIGRNDVPIYANRYLLDFLGYPDEDACYAEGGMARVFEQLRSGSDAVGLRSATGETVAVRCRLQTIDWDGLPATLLTLCHDEGRDARNRLEAEVRALKVESTELTAILDTATDGLALIDAQGHILALNRSGEALFGYDQADVVGRPFTMLIAPESQTIAQRYFDGLQTGGVASLLNDGREIIGKARRGGEIPIFLTLGRIGAGREQKYCALLRDLTHWKKVEQELDAARREAERASALKSDFLAKVSHEIRTPLNAILGFAEVIMEERFGPIGNERYKDYLRDIHTSGAHVMSLVNDLLDLSKIEAGRMDLDFIAVDPNRVIAECVAIMQPQASQERVIMRLALAQNLPRILADERSLRQIVLNLLSNAVKFNEPGGQVIIATALADSGHAVIRIRDTGIGMSEGDIETALEPFRQLSTARQSEGTGLGLPLTKALVEANRASFSIKSKKNEGTLVEVVFPPERLLSRDPLSA